MDAGAKAGATNSEAVSESNTIFNDMEVPPMKELTGESFNKDTGKGYWYKPTSTTLKIGTGNHLAYMLFQVYQTLFTLLPSLSSNCADMADIVRVLLRESSALYAEA